MGLLLDLAPRSLALSESSSRLVCTHGKFNESQDDECLVGRSMWYFTYASKMNRRLIEMRSSLALSALLAVSVLAFPCGAQTSSPSSPVQNQAGQTSQAEPSVGVSGQANAGPTSVPTPGVGSTRSSDVGKRFSSAGRGLPGMSGGPPSKGLMGSQDPASRYMRPPVIPPLLCDPAINIPC